MKNLKITEGADPNYLATIIKCPELKDHPDAERLQIATVFGNDIIVAKDTYIVGEKLVYFPVESCLSQKFLSWANLLDKAELNSDGKTTGFFSPKHGRVKAVKLRGVPSQGFVFKVSKLAEYYEVEETLFNTGDIFDSVGDDLLVTKYVRKERQSGEPAFTKSRVPKWVEKSISVLPRPIRRQTYKVVNSFYNKNNESIKSRIVEGEFQFHGKTEHLGKNIHLLNPNDFITVTEKLHGCIKHDTPVETLEFGVLPIKKIVEDRLDVHVKGYDIEHDEIKWVKVDEYYFKPNDGEWYEIELECGKIITITGNNPVWLPELSCYRRTDNLKIGDTLLLESVGC